MTRESLEGLISPHPIGARLPGVYLDDDFTQRLTEALDGVLAPVFLALDSFPAYLDPYLTPEDFLDVLASWAGVQLDADRPLAERRELVAHAVSLHRQRGTPGGLAAHVALLTGGEVEIADSGGCTWSPHPGADLPDEQPRVTVRITGGRDVDERRVLAVISETVPAHVAVTLEVGTR
ncbi:phage tail protein [Longispora albida]|uniref:phage tail protein n=1 Tax=Longispora albida TaxID=203523 RepID=UPI00037CF039|nr:phage tail protein [Longispora albida]